MIAGDHDCPRTTQHAAHWWIGRDAKGWDARQQCTGRGRDDALSEPMETWPIEAPLHELNCQQEMPHHEHRWTGPTTASVPGLNICSGAGYAPCQKDGEHDGHYWWHSTSAVRGLWCPGIPEGGARYEPGTAGEGSERASSAAETTKPSPATHHTLPTGEEALRAAFGAPEVGAGASHESGDTGPRIEAGLHDAIAELFDRFGEGLLIKWVALVEVIDQDGETALWPFTSPGLTAWDSKGMLTHGLDTERARTLFPEE